MSATVIEHAGKGVVILDCYPWRVALSVPELLAVATLAADPEACRAACVLADSEVRRTALLAAVARLVSVVRLRLIDQINAVVDQLSPPWAPADLLPRDCAGVDL